MDKYDSCPEFAKNHYCTDYKTLMKVQCRKSCKFCGKLTVWMQQKNPGLYCCAVLKHAEITFFLYIITALIVCMYM